MYPHLSLYKNNQPINYPLTRSRDVESLLDFLADMIQNNYLNEIKSTEEFINIKNENEFAIVFKGDSHLEHFEILAKNHKTVKMFWTTNVDVIKVIGFREDGVNLIFLRKFDEGDRLFNFDQVPYVWHFNSLVQNYKFPKIRNITEESFENALLKQENSLIFVYAQAEQDDIQKNEQNEQSFREFLRYTKNNEKFKFFKIEKENKLIKELLDALGRSHSGNPYLIIMSFDQHPYRKFRFEKKITFQSIKDWVEKLDLGQINESLKSASIPTEQDPDITQAVGLTFNKEVLDNNEHIYLFVYSKWCEESRRSLHILKSIAINSKKWDIPVKWVAFELTQNEAKTLRNFQHYPAIALYQNGRKKYPVWYDGEFSERRLENFLHFVVDNKKKYDEDL